MRHLPALLLAALLAARPLSAAVPRVITDFAPVQSLAAKVMGDLGTPEVLVTGGADPHDYQLRPSQASALAAADLVIWVGPEMTPWLARILDEGAGRHHLGLLADPATARRTFADTDAVDPHAWLDPEIAKAWVGLIRDALIAADAGNAATYRANAMQAEAGLDALETDVRRTLAPVQRPIVVGHDAFGYFAARFGLPVAMSVETGDAAEPGARHLHEIRALLEAGQATCLFPEAGQDPARAALLVDGTPARLGPPLDPEGLTLTHGAGLYDDLLRGLATAIVSCAAG